MLGEEINTKQPNKTWVRYVKHTVEEVNKAYEKTPQSITPDNELIPKCTGDACNILPVGTKVRKQLDNPTEYTKGNRLHGRFRAGDIRWDKKPQTITETYLEPTQPPMYQLDNNRNVSYTKAQLQIVDKNESLPNTNLVEIEKLIGRKNSNNKIFYEVKWKNNPKTTQVSRQQLMQEVPDLVRQFEKPFKANRG